MAPSLLEKYQGLSKEELLQLDLSELSNIRQEMGDQQFIDQWKLTQEEYSYLINQIPESIVITETPVKKQAEVKTRIGTVEILHPTRRGPATTISNAVITSTTKVVEQVTTSKVLTTSSYIPTTSSYVATEEREIVWKAERPAYSIIRHGEPVATSTLTTSSYVPVS